MASSIEEEIRQNREIEDQVKGLAKTIIDNLAKKDPANNYAFSYNGIDAWERSKESMHNRILRIPKPKPRGLLSYLFGRKSREGFGKRIVEINLELFYNNHKQIRVRYLDNDNFPTIENALENAIKEYFQKETNREIPVDEIHFYVTGGYETIKRNEVLRD